MITREAKLGRSQEITSGVDFTILFGAGKLAKVVATAAGLKGKLPDATMLRRGGPYLYVWNAGSNAFSLADFGNNAVYTVNPNKVVIVGLLTNTTQNGLWEFIERTKAAITVATPSPVVITLQVVDPTTPTEVELYGIEWLFRAPDIPKRRPRVWGHESGGSRQTEFL